MIISAHDLLTHCWQVTNCWLMVHRHFSRLLADDWPTVSSGNCSSLLPALTKHKWLLIWSTHDSMCLLTVLFNLLYKVEKNLLTLLLLLETVDSQFNCDHWQIFLLRILSSHELRFFMALFFHLINDTQNHEKLSLMSETILLLEICPS